MCKIIGKIENFDPKKSYPIDQPTTKYIPEYAWVFDTEEGDYVQTIVRNVEVTITDLRTAIFTNDYE